jgi:hypothetical protein
MKKLWFKNKSYGYGWTPATPEGWAITAGFVFTVIINIYLYSIEAYDTKVSVFVFLIAIVAFIGIAYYTGEKLQWINTQSPSLEAIDEE